MTNNPRPLIPVDPKGLDKIVDALLKGENVPDKDRETPPTGSTEIADPASYLILEAPKRKGYTYPDLLVGTNRLSYNAVSRQVAPTLSFATQDTGTGLNGQRYIGNINWEQALTLNLRLGNITLTPRQHGDLRALLEDGANGKRKVYYGNGQIISRPALVVMRDEILKITDPWRSEWLDARFVNKGKVLNIEYGHRLQANNKLVPTYSEPLEAFANQGWVDSASLNKQGFPQKASKKQELHFWTPSNGTVARFDAGSGGSDLGCDRDPSVANSHLGVRPVRAKN